MKLSLVQRGDRGLFIEDGRRLLFPDRSWKDVKEGFACDVEVVNDKGTYAFVRGRMIETCPAKWIPQGCTYQGVINGQEFFLKDGSNGPCMAYVIVQGVDGVYTERFSPETKTMSWVRFLFRYAEQIDLVKDMIESAQPLNFEDDATYAFEMMKLLSEVSSDFRSYYNCPSIELRVYNSSIVTIKIKLSKYSDDRNIRMYRHVGEVGSGIWAKVNDVPDEQIVGLFEKSDPVDLEEIIDLANEFHMCVDESRFSDCFDSRLSKKDMSFMSSGVTVYAFNLNVCSVDWVFSDAAAPYRDLVDESFIRFEMLRKQMGKIGGEASLKAMESLNLNKWLVPFTPMKES